MAVTEPGDHQARRQPNCQVNTDSIHPKGLSDVGDAVCSGDVEGLGTQARHDAWVDADAAGVLGEGHVANPMVLILHGPMTADGSSEDVRGQHDGRRIKCDFFAPFPESRGGGADQCETRDAHDRGDQRRPFAVIEKSAGCKDFDTPVFLPISRQIAAIVTRDRNRRRGDVLAALQQARLVAFDLNDQLIAGCFGDLEGFFDSAWRRA